MPSARSRVLIVDDEPSFLEVLKFNVQGQGHHVVAVPSGEAALTELEHGPFDALITDLRMPGMSGEALVEAAHAKYPDMPILVVTAFADVEVAVHVMRHGAVDLITKPLQRDLFRHRLDQVLHQHDLQRENVALRQELSARQGTQALIATSPAMERVLDHTRRVAASDATVLIQGASGTGKELLARSVHTQSQRADGPFVAVNCAAIPAELLESELFGHRKGAFTGATRDREGKFLQANGGTLFLDEVGALPEPLQAKLLRVLQEREVDLVGGGAPVPLDVRIVAATNTNLDDAVVAGTFRQDLYYRLNVITLHLPPLMQRREDILPLLHHFLREFGAERVRIEPRAEQALLTYAWPGNIRELQNLCQQLALLREHEDRITWIDLPEGIRSNRPRKHLDALQVDIGPDGISLDAVERDLLLYGLERMDWNQTRAAKFLGISRQTLIYRMRKFNITPPTGALAAAAGGSYS